MRVKALLVGFSAAVVALAATPGSSYASDRDQALAGTENSAVFSVFGEISKNSDGSLSTESLASLGADESSIDGFMNGTVSADQSVPDPSADEDVPMQGDGIIYEPDSGYSAAARDPAYAFVSSWRDRNGRSIVMRRGRIDSAGRGFGLTKVQVKHNLTLAAVRAGTAYTPEVWRVQDEKYNYRTPVYKVKCTGFWMFRRCYAIDSVPLITSADGRILDDGRGFGVVTSYCQNGSEWCPDWVKNAVNAR